jgi:hypothetical protein
MGRKYGRLESASLDLGTRVDGPGPGRLLTLQISTAPVRPGQNGVDLVLSWPTDGCPFDRSERPERGAQRKCAYRPMAEEFTPCERTHVWRIIRPHRSGRALGC